MCVLHCTPHGKHIPARASNPNKRLYFPAPLPRKQATTEILLVVDGKVAWNSIRPFMTNEPDTNHLDARNHHSVVLFTAAGLALPDVESSVEYLCGPTSLACAAWASFVVSSERRPFRLYCGNREWVPKLGQVYHVFLVPAWMSVRMALRPVVCMPDADRYFSAAPLSPVIAALDYMLLQTIINASAELCPGSPFPGQQRPVRPATRPPLLTRKLVYGLLASCTSWDGSHFGKKSAMSCSRVARAFVNLVRWANPAVCFYVPLGVIGTAVKDLERKRKTALAGMLQTYIRQCNTGRQANPKRGRKRKRSARPASPECCPPSPRQPPESPCVAASFAKRTNPKHFWCKLHRHFYQLIERKNLAIDVLRVLCYLFSCMTTSRHGEEQEHNKHHPQIDWRQMEQLQSAKQGSRPQEEVDLRLLVQTVQVCVPQALRAGRSARRTIEWSLSSAFPPSSMLGDAAILVPYLSPHGTESIRAPVSHAPLHSLVEVHPDWTLFVDAALTRLAQRHAGRVRRLLRRPPSAPTSQKMARVWTLLLMGMRMQSPSPPLALDAHVNAVNARASRPPDVHTHTEVHTPPRAISPVLCTPPQHNPARDQPTLPEERAQRNTHTGVNADANSSPPINEGATTHEKIQIKLPKKRRRRT